MTNEEWGIETATTRERLATHHVCVLVFTVQVRRPYASLRNLSFYAVIDRSSYLHHHNNYIFLEWNHKRESERRKSIEYKRRSWAVLQHSLRSSVSRCSPLTTLHYIPFHFVVHFWLVSYVFYLSILYCMRTPYRCVKYLICSVAWLAPIAWVCLKRLSQAERTKKKM